MTQPTDPTGDRADSNLELPLGHAVARRGDPQAILERGVEWWPFASLARGSKPRVEYSITEPNGDVFVFSTASERGLPGPLANDVYVVLQHLLNEAMGRTASRYPPGNQITTTLNELVTLLRMDRGGEQYRLIREALEDMQAVRVKGVHVFKGGKMRKQVQNFQLFNLVEFNTPRDRDHGETVVRVKFNEELLTNMIEEESRWFRLMGLGTYFRLDLPTSKRLFRYLAMRRYRGSMAMPTLSLTLRDLKDHLPVLAQEPRLIKRTLETAHEELVKTEILAEMPTIEKGKERGASADNWIVTYTFAQTGLYADAVRQGASSRVASAKPLGLPVAVIEEKDQPDYYSGAVRKMVSVLGSQKDIGWYMKVAKALTPDQLRAELSDIEAEKRTGTWASLKALRVTFTKRVQARARALGIDL